MPQKNYIQRRQLKIIANGLRLFYGDIKERKDGRELMTMLLCRLSMEFRQDNSNYSDMKFINAVLQ